MKEVKRQGRNLGLSASGGGWSLNASLAHPVDANGDLLRPL